MDLKLEFFERTVLRKLVKKRYKTLAKLRNETDSKDFKANYKEDQKQLEEIFNKLK